MMHPRVFQLIMDSLRHWIQDMHVRPGDEPVLDDRNPSECGLDAQVTGGATHEREPEIVDSLLHAEAEIVD